MAEFTAGHHRQYHRWSGRRRFDVVFSAQTYQKHSQLDLIRTVSKGAVRFLYIVISRNKS